MGLKGSTHSLSAKSSLEWNPRMVILSICSKDLKPLVKLKFQRKSFKDNHIDDYHEVVRQKFLGEKRHMKVDSADTGNREKNP